MYKNKRIAFRKHSGVKISKKLHFITKTKNGWRNEWSLHPQKEAPSLIKAYSLMFAGQITLRDIGFSILKYHITLRDFVIDHPHHTLEVLRSRWIWAYEMLTNGDEFETDSYDEKYLQEVEIVLKRFRRQAKRFSSEIKEGEKIYGCIVEALGQFNRLKKVVHSRKTTQTKAV